MKDFLKDNPNKYAWNEWAIYVVSSLKEERDGREKAETRIKDLEQDIAVLKSLEIKDSIDDYHTFKATINAKVKLIAFLISISVGALTLLIHIILLLTT